MEAYEKKYGFKKYSTFLFLVSNVYKNEEIDLLNKKNSMPYYLDKPLNKKKLVHILEKNLSLQVTV
jgi:hypothetical protein